MLTQFNLGMVDIALIGVIYWLYRLLKDVKTYFSCKKMINTTALVKELADRKITYKNKRKTKVRYVENFYIFEVEHQGIKYNIEFCEILSEDRESDFKINSQVPVYFNIYKQEVKSVDELKLFMKRSVKNLAFYVIALIIFYLLFLIFFPVHTCYPG